jgi:hypothetical protein
MWQEANGSSETNFAGVFRVLYAEDRSFLQSVYKCYQNIRFRTPEHHFTNTRTAQPIQINNQYVYM